MHYCPRCSPASKLEPSGACPSCGEVVAQIDLQPVFFLSGASGAGKTTLVPVLARALRGECAVFDMDWLIDPLGTTDWPKHYDTWLHVAAGVGHSGQPTLIAGSFLPDTVCHVPGRRWVGDVHFAALVCDRDSQHARLTARPTWRESDSEVQAGFADWLRNNLSPVFDTTSAAVEAVAGEVVAWVRSSM